EHVAREVGGVVVDRAAPLDAVGLIRAGVESVLGLDGAGAVQLQEQVVAVPDVACGRGVGPLPHAPAPAVVGEAYPARATGPDAIQLAERVPVEALIEAGLVLAGEVPVVVVLEGEAVERGEAVAGVERRARIGAVADLVVGVGLLADELGGAGRAAPAVVGAPGAGRP